MRLLQPSNNGSGYCLTEDLADDGRIPPYAILSHTWEEGQEVTFDDLRDGTASQTKHGWNKIHFCGQQAERDGLKYFWVDTCCIDKSNYGELKDAINSMFRWYQRATKCYVYLSDISADGSTDLSAQTDQADGKTWLPDFEWEYAFRSSRWFTRGWTLQELLAPSSVEFFTRKHVRLGDRSSLLQQIHKVTGISKQALQGVPLSQFNVNERLSWMENRRTTKEEDRVYSLLGIFGVYMPPVYGEGTGIAFKRLREEIEKLENCLRDLRLTDPNDDKKRIEETKGGLLEASYTWVLDNPDFQQWRNSQHGLLWVKGDPGKGKTMLLCGIVDELRKSKAYTDTLSFFFCQDADSRINNATAVLRGLLYMLVNQQPYLISHIRKKYDHSGKALFEDTNSWVAISEIFADVIQDPYLSSTYLVIDALDECIVGLPKLLDFLTKKWSSSRAKWIVSSRNWVEIEQRIDQMEQSEQPERNVRLSLELNAESVSTAVGIFTRHKVAELAQEMRYNDKMRDAVLQHLESNADSTFLWVALVCQSLKRVAQRHVMKKLDSFPPGLDSLYQRMMQQVRDSDDADLCKEIIASVATVFRPISLVELATLVEQVECLGNDIELIREIISLCGSFLTLREDTIYFVHQSAKNFVLTKVHDEVFPSGSVGVHYTLFSRSLRNLSDTLRRDMYNIKEAATPIDCVSKPDPDPLAASQYSCIHWIDHLCGSNLKSLEPDLQDKGTVAVFIKKKYLYWLEALSICKSMPKGLVSMAYLEAFVTGIEGADSLLKLVQDAFRFIMAHKLAIGNYPLQTYMSALVFSPTGSRIRRLFRKERPKWITIKPPTNETWGACLQTLEGHGSIITDVAFTHDSKWLASASRDTTIKIWDTSSGECLQTLKGHREYVWSVKFSHDSTQLASSSEDGTIKIWDPAKGDCLQILYCHGEPIRSISFSHDSTQLASAASSFDKAVKIWDVRSGQCLQSFEGHDKAINAVVFSHDSKKIASASKDGTARIWEVKSGECLQTLDGYGGWVQAVCFSHNSTKLASALRDWTIKIWDAITGEWLETLEGHTSNVNSVAFSHNSTRLASCSNDGTLRVWDVDTGNCMQTLEGHVESVQAVAFSHNSNWLASGSFDHTVKIWDASQDGVLDLYERHENLVISVALSHDCKWLASGSTDTYVMIWDISTGIWMQTLRGHTNSVNAVAFSQDSQWLASASWDKDIRIWDVRSGTCLMSLVGHADAVLSVDVSNDSEFVASGSKDRTVKIWSVNSGECLKNLDGHGNRVNSVAVSPDSKFVCSASDDQTVRVWDMRSGHCLHTLKHRDNAPAAAFSPDSEWLATASKDRTVKIWHVSTGVCLQTYTTGTTLQQISFDSTGSCLYTHAGTVDIEHPSISSSSVRQPFQYRNGGAYALIGEAWISYDGKLVLWLPPEYRPYSISARRNHVAIGTGSGKVWICSFNSKKKEATA